MVMILETEASFSSTLEMRLYSVFIFAIDIYYPKKQTVTDRIQKSFFVLKRNKLIKGLIYICILIECKMGNCQSIDQTKIQAPRQGPVRQLIINNYVWSRKYLGLYDYEAQEVQKRRYEIQGNSVVLKDNDKLILIDERMDKLVKGLPEHMKSAIFRLSRNDNYYQLAPIIYEERGELIQKPVWLVVRTLPRKSYSIKERDIFKLGKQKMRVREVVPADYNQSVVVPNENINLSKACYDDLNYQQPVNNEDKQEEMKLPVRIEQKQGKTQLEGVNLPIQSAQTIGEETHSVQLEGDIFCRICLQPGLNSNPLITPCKCTGSVRYIHLLCLKTWLSKQIKAVINDFSVTINWKPLCCEMCKSLYKYRIYLDNKKFYTVDIPKPEKPYLVLEIMKKKKKEEGRIFKFITFKQKNIIQIGRKKDVDVKISEDISVSRIHATLRYKYETQEFLLEDNKSKFGTLVLAKNGLNLRPHHSGISVQVGAQVYEFEPLREATQIRSFNYQMGEQYMREQISEQSDNDEQQNHSEEEDEVGELPVVDDNDRSPMVSQRSPQIRRSQSLGVEHSHFR